MKSYYQSVETVDTYVKVPTELAERLGKSNFRVLYSNHPIHCERVGKLKFNDDSISHIKVIKPASEFMKKMVTIVSYKMLLMEKEGVMIQHEGCVECGTCSEETDWKHPRGEKGINYQYG